jgi:hypothetical protein
MVTTGALKDKFTAQHSKVLYTAKSHTTGGRDGGASQPLRVAILDYRSPTAKFASAPKVHFPKEQVFISV